MTFIEKLMQDATPKATTIKNATSNLCTKIADSKAVAVSKALGYKGLVNTVGIGMVIAQPLVEKAKKAGSTVWNKVEELAADPKKA